jgi:hypothetical protein
MRNGEIPHGMYIYINYREVCVDVNKEMHLVNKNLTIARHIVMSFE